MESVWRLPALWGGFSSLNCAGTRSIEVLPSSDTHLTPTLLHFLTRSYRHAPPAHLLIPYKSYSPAPNAQIAMHDVKILWQHGHAYHHQWRTPDQMIGVTNYSFDALVEGWVTMSSAFAPMIMLPLNFSVVKSVSFLYMVSAVFLHWDGFPIRYHLQHHYLVVKNYGSHIPVFDIIFGTFQGPYLSWH